MNNPADSLAEIKAEMERLLPYVVRYLALKHAHWKLSTSLRMKALHKDPAFRAKFQRGKAVALRDPGRMAAWQQKISKSKQILPEMSAEQQKTYNRYRYQRKMSREDALRQAGVGL